ncbi:hypothetical protein, partial [Atlanticothrix silvestris]|uniref:hypothetical protein n=1 Tax=Atlanticothrix silvestris TaxID=2840444 RepID=UPI001BDDB474
AGREVARRVSLQANFGEAGEAGGENESMLPFINIKLTISAKGYLLNDNLMDFWASNSLSYVYFIKTLVTKGVFTKILNSLLKFVLFNFS